MNYPDQSAAHLSQEDTVYKDPSSIPFDGKKWLKQFIGSFPPYSIVPEVLRGCKYYRGVSPLTLPSGEKKRVLILKVAASSIEQMNKIMIVRQLIIARLSEMDCIDVCFIACEPSGQPKSSSKMTAILMQTGEEYKITVVNKRIPPQNQPSN